MNGFEKLANIGVKPGQPGFLQEKIKQTNWVAALVASIIGLPFVIISLLYFPPLTLIPLIGIVICVAAIGANALNLFTLSRLIMAMLPISLAAGYHAALVPLNETPVAGIFLIELSFALIPFLIFDTRETGWLIATSLFNFLLIATFDATKGVIETDLDNSLLREGFLAHLAQVLGISIGLAIVAVLAVLHRASEDKASSLLEQARQKQRELEESSEKLETTIAEMKKIQQIEKERKKEEENRAWANRGLAKFGDILRQNPDNFSKLAKEIIHQLIAYLEINQGGLFLINDKQPDDIHIQALACVAYNRQRKLKKRIELHDGLIGRCIDEKKSIYLRELPPNYIEITSGFGNENPSVLLLVPLKLHDKVLGVFELASFEEFPHYKKEFVENLAEDVAAAFQNMKINIRTNELLTQLKKQAQEKAAQEEELRQNLEELRTTQEEMQRRNDEAQEKLNKAHSEQEKLKNKLHEKEKQIQQIKNSNTLKK